MPIETDSIKIAKELLKKAEELNDPELLDMANRILSKCSPNSNSTTNNTSVKPKRQKKAKKPVKPKKPKPSVNDTDSYIHTNTRKDVRQSKTDENGKEKIACRIEPISVKTQPLDTGEERNNRPKKYKKLKTGIVTSSRKKVSPFVKLTCRADDGDGGNLGCGRSVTVPRALSRENFICDRCIMKKGTR